jgi:uncharacterized protein GlcG (DUF336 family)
MEASVREITLECARQIVTAAMELAARRLATRATIVVTDVSGAIRALERNDAAGPYGADFALAKARTALGMRSSTLGLASAFLDRPSVVSCLNASVGGNFLPMGGGVVVLDKDGEVIGAAGFSGAAHEVDHEIASAAASAAGLQVLD